MRRGVRLDLFICMVIAAAIFAGIWFLGDKLGVVDKIFDGVGAMVDGSKDVPAGEVGGYATDETPRISTMQDLVALSEEGKTFTVETASTRYLNYGVYEGTDNYEWRILKLDDGNALAVKLNIDKIQDIEDSYDVILPVGKVVFEQPGALAEIREDIGDSDLTFIVDAYIDMDGEANTTYINSKQQSAIMVIGGLMMILPIVAFILYIATVFAIHAVFVKIGIFPPVFKNKNKA